MKNNSPIDLKNQLLSVISQMQSVSHLFVETGKDFSRKRKNFFLRYHSVSLIYGREYHSERMVRFLGFFSGYGFGSRLLIIPGLFEPPVRTLRATIPENESHIFR